MKTAATNKRVRELISLVQDGKLVPRPDFQRRLVWTHSDKERFLDTVSRGLPFPEIYLADGEVNLETGAGTQLLVDGLQRISTLVQYFQGDPALRLTTVMPYASLSEEHKRSFLQYEVAVRDLGSATRELIIDVFRRINATKYSLNEIEVNQARFGGALKQFAEAIAEHDFFARHFVFSAADFKRMGDLRFALSVTITMIGGYFNRDDAFEEFLSRYNDEFSLGEELRARFRACMDFIDECNFLPNSRAWKKADLFTLLVELDRALSQPTVILEPHAVVETISAFFERVEATDANGTSIAAIYYKAALQATNDRTNRLRRGVVIGGLLAGHSEAEVCAALERAGLRPEPT